MSHLKRLSAPKTWKISRKVNKYITSSNPGAHSRELSLPLVTLMTDLGLARNKKEVKYLLQHKGVFVDGKRRYEEKLPVGLMDVLSIPSAKANFRVLISAKGLEAKPVSDGDSKIKLVKITGKSQIKGGKTQLHTHDGRNIFVDKDVHNIGDSLLIELTSQKIKDSFKFEKGASIFVFKGKQTGKVGNVKKIETRTMTITIGKEEYETRKAYAFVVGKDKPIIKLE